MNILPHKSWHVRTKKNISRVRRDEERARKEEEELQKRINLAEHESRIVQLKRKAGIKIQEPDKKTTSESFELFEDFKDKLAEDSGRQVEKKAEQEKWEVRTGIFSYLDGRYKYDNNDKTNGEWYLRSHEDRIGFRDPKTEAEDKVKMAKDEKIKSFNDPLETMKSYLNVMKKNESDSLISTQTTKSIKRKIPNDLDIQSTSSSSSKKKKHKKHKRKHRQDGSSDDSDGDESEKKKLLIEKLRAERLDREKKERERTMILLRVPSSSSTSSDSKSGIKQKYNSQFNPHLARQNMTDNDHGK